MKRASKLGLSLLVTLLFSWWAFRGTDWAQQWNSLRTANYLWLVPYVAVLLAVHLCRTLRWGALLSGIERVPFRALNEASAIGFMMLIVLPFRLGEFARPLLIAQRSGVRRSAAMTTVVLERIADGISVAVLLRVLLFFVPGDSTQLRLVKAGANVMFAIFAGGLLFLLFALWQQARAVGLVRATVGRVSPGLADKVAGVVDSFVGAMRQLPGPAGITWFCLFTLGYWGLNGAGMAMLAQAFDCGQAGPGCAPLTLSLFQGYVVMCVLVVGVMIPAAPGMMGTFQWAIKTGLELFLPAVVVNASGIAFANVVWLSQTVQQVALGLLMLSFSQFSFRDLAGRLNAEEKDAAQRATPAH